MVLIYLRYMEFEVLLVGKPNWSKEHIVQRLTGYVGYPERYEEINRIRLFDGDLDVKIGSVFPRRVHR